MMESLFLRLKLWGAGAGMLLAGLLGGADTLLRALLGFMAADLLTGLTKAVIHRELHSGRMFTGGLKKMLVFVVVGVAAMLDRLLPDSVAALRGLTIGYYLAGEGLSILENAAACGLPLPAKLREVLSGLRS